jgi:DNA-binding MarR family transcriptional regulator
MSDLSRVCEVVAEMCACGSLRRASRATSRLYEAAFAPLKLTATQFTILIAVHLRGPVPLSRLAQALVLDRTSLYRAVKPLERRGCLRILPGRTRRERTASLTPKGQELLEQALPIWERVQARLVRALGSNAWAALARALGKIVPTIQAIEPGAGRSTPSVRRPRAASS